MSTSEIFNDPKREYQLVESERPNDLITVILLLVDFYAPLPLAHGGIQYIFVTLDGFTKYIKLYPIKKQRCE